MTVEVVAFPTSLFPSAQVLVPDRGPGQSMGESTFVGVQGVTTMRGSERWALNLELRDLTGAFRAEAMAFVTRLRISHNVFLCVNHTAPQRGNLGGTPLATTGTSERYLVANFCGASIDNWARAGDFVSVDCMLKMVLRDVGTDASGVASMYVWPPFANIPAGSTPVIVSSPCGAFRAVDVMAMNTNPPGYVTDILIRAVERINSEQVADFL